jgi:hypothetical protein
MELSVDSAKSRVRVHTFAEGLFARLAHDIELVFTKVEGTASREGEAGQAKLTVRLDSAEVAGVLKDGRVDASVLSASDRRDILEKMRREVFHAGEDATVTLEATLDGKVAKVKVVPPRGKTVEATTRPELREDGDALRISGSFDVSLSAIGSDVVKGPMNAFRVKDRVVVRFELVCQPA